MVFIWHSLFSEKPAIGTPNQQRLTTYDTVPDDDPIYSSQNRTSHTKVTPLGKNMPRGPGRGAENWVPSSLWPLTQRVTLGNSLRASLGLFPFLRAGWAEMI